MPLPSQVLTMDLGGTAWTLQQAGQSEKLPAQVPGDHYSDLLRAGKIPDPYYRDNNKAVQWAANTGWTYQRTFEATPQQLNKMIEPLTVRQVGRPPEKPQVRYRDFEYQAKSWNRARRVVAKVEWHRGSCSLASDSS